jgi:Ca2+-binding EF-hand superfamily protein
MIFRCVWSCIAVSICGATQSAVAAQLTAEQIQQAVASELPKRFAAADVDHDGRLTGKEAQDAMPRVYRHFDEIDVDRHGYVTEQDIVRAVNQQLSREPGRQGQ